MNKNQKKKLNYLENIKIIPKPTHRNIGILEWCAYLYVLCLVMSSTGDQTRWWFLQRIYPGDFITYINAAQGNFGYYWIYKDWIAPIFTPLLWFNPFDAYMYWTALNTFCFLLMVHKLFEVEYGWIPVIITAPFIRDYFQQGNIQAVLCLVAFYPLPSFLVVLCKPHYIIFPISHAIMGRYRIRSNKGTGVLENR